MTSTPHLPARQEGVFFVRPKFLTTSSEERVKNADFAQRPSDLKFTTAGR